MLIPNPSGHACPVRSTRDSWLSIWLDACSLGFEASSVIGLRVLTIGAGGALGEAEAHRMISEKIEASSSATKSLNLIGASTAWVACAGSELRVARQGPVVLARLIHSAAAGHVTAAGGMDKNASAQVALW